MNQYGQPDGSIVLDFTTQAERLKSIPRSTRSSRTPGGRNVGTVYSKHVHQVRCQDCGRLCDGAVEPGRHAPHTRESKTVNCVGKEIRPWP